MKNTQKGFAIPLIIALVALIAIGGGVYIYNQNNYNTGVPIDTHYFTPNSDFDELETNGEIEASNDTNNDQATQNNSNTNVATQNETPQKPITTRVTEEQSMVQKMLRSRSLDHSEKDYIGFWFTKENPAALHPWTRMVAEKRHLITEQDLNIGNIKSKILLKNNDSVVIDLQTGGCLGTDQGKGFPSLYVYASRDSEKIFVFKFSKDAQTDISKQLQSIGKYVDETKNQPEITEITIQPAPTEVVSDGYHYAKLAGFNTEKESMTIDFISVNTSSDTNFNFDVIMNKTSNIMGPSTNVSLINNLVRNREINFIPNKYMLEFIGSIDERFQSVFPIDVLLKIKDGKVIDITRISYVC